MESLVLILHVLVAVAMTGLILLQQGKGAEMGASFGAGSSQTVFGAAGSVGFMVKATAILGAIFFATSLGLAVYARQHAQSFGAVPNIPAEVVKKAPLGDLPVVPVSKLAPATSGTTTGAADIPAAPAAPATK
jgi:preprotein translocase subunit SecG